MDATSVLMNQEMSRNNNSLENMLVCSKSQQDHQKRLLQKPQQDQQQQQQEQQKCPRCDSTNTKFCYYNNYSLTQPRYFCKGCRRYWTKGGALRNIPVGGGCRKNHRPSPSSSSSSSSLAKRINTTQDHYDHQQPYMINTTHYNNVNLSLDFSMLPKQSVGQLGFDDHDHNHNHINQLSILGNIRNNNIFHGTTSTTTDNDHFFGNFENVYYGGGIGNSASNVRVEMENGNVPYWQFGGSETNVATSWHGFLNSSTTPLV